MNAMNSVTGKRWCTKASSFLALSFKICPVSWACRCWKRAYFKQCSSTNKTQQFSPKNQSGLCPPNPNVRFGIVSLRSRKLSERQRIWRNWRAISETIQLLQPQNTFILIQQVKTLNFPEYRMVSVKLAQGPSWRAGTMRLVCASKGNQNKYLDFIFCHIFIELVLFCLPVEAVNLQMQVSSTGAVLPTHGAQPDCILQGR